MFLFCVEQRVRASISTAILLKQRFKGGHKLGDSAAWLHDA